MPSKMNKEREPKKKQQQQQKRKGGKKSERRGEDKKWKWSHFKAQKLEILLSAHAITLEVDILHPQKKATKGKTCKRLFGKFQLLIAR